MPKRLTVFINDVFAISHLHDKSQFFIKSNVDYLRHLLEKTQKMSTSKYHFVSNWLVDAAIDEVNEILKQNLIDIYQLLMAKPQRRA